MKRFVLFFTVVVMLCSGVVLLYFALSPEQDNGFWESGDPYMLFDARDYSGEILINGEMTAFRILQDGDFFDMYGVRSSGKIDRDNHLMSGYMRFYGEKLQILSDDGKFVCTLHKTERRGEGVSEAAVPLISVW